MSSKLLTMVLLTGLTFGGQNLSQAQVFKTSPDENQQAISVLPKGTASVNITMTFRPGFIIRPLNTSDSRSADAVALKKFREISEKVRNSMQGADSTGQPIKVSGLKFPMVKKPNLWQNGYEGTGYFTKDVFEKYVSRLAGLRVLSTRIATPRGLYVISVNGGGSELEDPVIYDELTFKASIQRQFIPRRGFRGRYEPTAASTKMLESFREKSFITMKGMDSTGATIEVEELPTMTPMIYPRPPVMELAVQCSGKFHKKGGEQYAMKLSGLNKMIWTGTNKNGVERVFVRVSGGKPPIGIRPVR